MCLGANRAGPPSAPPPLPSPPLPHPVPLCPRRCGLSAGRVPITRGIARKNQPRINQPLPLLRSPSRFLSISLFLRRGKFELSLEDYRMRLARRSRIQCSNSLGISLFICSCESLLARVVSARSIARPRGVPAIIYADCKRNHSFCESCSECNTGVISGRDARCATNNGERGVLPRIDSQ